MTVNSFACYLAETAQEIDQALAESLQEMSCKFSDASTKLAPLVGAFIEGCEGGKRIRGALVKLGYALTDAPYTPEILKAAVALELFQTAILAHDDIIDKSPLRRGKPSMHYALGGDHRGISHTICLGDVGFFWAFKLIAESRFPCERKNRAISSFAQTTFETGVGEILDVELPYLSNGNNPQDVLSISELKTARYTVTGPLHLGAILGGEDDEYLSRLTDFGKNLGIAFQIQDDILGVFGKQEITGKVTRSDIEEGKSTLLSIHAYTHASDLQRSVLGAIYGGGEPVLTAHIESVQQIFLETGALDYARAQARYYTDQARKIIPDLSEDPEQTRLLEQLATYLVERDK